MNQSIISIRYAKALIMTGKENNCLKALEADAQLIAATIRDNQLFRQVLDNPIIKPTEKRNVMKELLSKHVNPLMLKFIDVIIHNRREFLLADVMRDFIDLYRINAGIKYAQIVSASGIDSDINDKLKKILADLFKADVQINSEQNPDLIGGLLLRIDGWQYDASLSSSLKRIKKEMASANFQ